MTTDDLRKKAEDAAKEAVQREELKGGLLGNERRAFVLGALWHASTLPALDEDELAQVIEQQLTRYTLPANYNTPLFEEHADVARRCAPFIAHAVIQHLTGGSNE